MLLKRLISELKSGLCVENNLKSGDYDKSGTLRFHRLCMYKKSPTFTDNAFLTTAISCEKVCRTLAVKNK